MRSIYYRLISVSLLPLLAMAGPAQRRVAITESAESAAARLITKTPPPYPPVAKAARIQGTVVLDAIISKTGGVEDLRVVSGPPMLQQAALEAVKTWQYRPYLVNGEPIEVETSVNVIFMLGGDARPSGTANGPADAAAHQGIPTSNSKDASFDVLRAAVEKGDLQDAAVWVSSASVDVNAHFDSGRTLLQVAIDKNEPAIVSLLLDNRADVNERDSTGISPLFVAANRGYADIVSVLMAHGADVNARTVGGSTALHTSAYFGFSEVVKILLSNRADLNAKQEDGETPLHLAAEGGHKETVELLVAANAIINPLNSAGETPLGEARMNAHSDIAQLLLQHGGTDPHAAANIKQLNNKVAAIKKPVDEETKDHDQYCSSQREACQIWAKARQQCATAGDYENCMQIKNTGDGFYKGSADTCNQDGRPLYCDK